MAGGVNEDEPGRSWWHEQASRNHHGSHLDLLHEPFTTLPRDMHAIIVPTGRGPDAMRIALTVARKLDCALVALCSKGSSAKEVAQLPEASGVRLIAIDTDALPETALPAFRTDSVLAKTRFERKTDTSAKRNFGLKLAKLIGWEHIAFLDDDIDVPEPRDLRAAAGLTAQFAGVALTVEGMPDNSVVCHAYREAGGDQKVFVGGGALAVAVSKTTSFFPNVYNEDWLFLLGDAGLQTTTSIGRVLQQPYDPFGNAERAQREELGDTLAEGLFWSLDNDGSLPDTSREYWVNALARRAAFVNDVTAMVEGMWRTRRRDRMLIALNAARRRAEFITPELCVRYIHAWRADRFTWRRHLMDACRDHVVPGSKARRYRRSLPGVHALLLRSLGLPQEAFHLSLPEEFHKNPANLRRSVSRAVGEGVAGDRGVRPFDVAEPIVQAGCAPVGDLDRQRNLLESQLA
jgi:hypothetical protein